MTATALALPVVEHPSSPADRFRCAHYACALRADECVRRQTHRQAGHGTWARKGGWVPPHLQYCASGNCDQGKAIAAALASAKGAAA